MHSPGLHWARTFSPGAYGHREQDIHRRSPHFQGTRVKEDDGGEGRSLVPVRDAASISGAGGSTRSLTVNHAWDGGYAERFLGERLNRTASARRGTANAPIRRTDRGTHGSPNQKAGRPAHRTSLPRRRQTSDPTRADWGRS